MRSRTKRFIGGAGLALLLAPMLAMILASPNSAASGFLQSSPDVSGTESPGLKSDVVIPSRYDCMIPPIGILNVLSTLNQVQGARFSDRLGSIPISSLSRGEPLTSEDADGIDWTLYQLAACANGLDPLAVLPLLSVDLQAALVDTAVNGGDLNEALGALPLVASDVADDGGVPLGIILNSWYWTDTNKYIDAIVEMPVAANSTGSRPQFLVTFIWDQSYWIIDRVWLIES